MKRESLESFAQRLTRLEITTYLVDEIPPSYTSTEAGVAVMTEAVNKRADALLAGVAPKPAGREEGVDDEDVPAPPPAPTAHAKTLSEAMARLHAAQEQRRRGPREEGAEDAGWSPEDERLADCATSLAALSDDTGRLKQDEETTMAAEKILSVGILKEPVIAARTVVTLGGDVQTILARGQLGQPGVLALHNEMVRVSTGFWGDLVRAITSMITNLVGAGR